MSSRGSQGLLILFCVAPLLLSFLPGRPNSASTTGMMATRPGLLTPAEFLLLLDLQYGGIVVQYGQNDLVHVLPQTQVDFLLLLQGLHQLRERRVGGFSSTRKVTTYRQLVSVGGGRAGNSTGSAILRMSSVPDLWRRCLFLQLWIEPWSASQTASWLRRGWGWGSGRLSRRSAPSASGSPEMQRVRGRQLNLDSIRVQ